MTDPRRDRAPDVYAHPLWPLVTILGDIAVRVTNQRADERASETPETRREAGSDPEPRGEVA